MKKRVLSIAGLLMLLMVAGLVSTTSPSAAPQTVTMVSGNGPIGTLDPFNEFSRDGGATWAPAHIVNKHAFWANPIAGSQWISVAQDLGFSNPPTAVRYRRFFDLPEDCETATLSVILHVDDDAALPAGGVFLNGVRFGTTLPGPLPTNFQNPPEGPFTTVGPFNEEGNLLEFRTSNVGGLWSGLDYEATLTCGEGCPPGDDDDNDGLTNQNENLLGTLLATADSDLDGIPDGNDDANGNGQDDEDEDDNDECPDRDDDGDGIDNEDEDD